MPKKKEVGLTNRQLDVLKLIIDGYDNNEVAEILDLKRTTVEAHRFTIMVKLGLHDVPALVKYGLKNNLTTLDKHRDHPKLPD
jgi:DNA-binding NarL/FixJ family response regulator